MVAVQNYLGNPAPPGKPVLTFQTGDVIELLRGDPESQWWEVGPGRISPPSAPLHSPGQKWKCRISRQGWVCGARPSEGRWLFAGPGCRGVCFDMAGGAASPRQRDRRPSPLPAASCLGCVLYTSPTLLPSRSAKFHKTAAFMHSPLCHWVCVHPEGKEREWETGHGPHG